MEFLEELGNMPHLLKMTQNRNVHEVDSEGNTLLHLVLQHMSVSEEFLRQLLNWGSEVNAVNHKQDTPLHCALKFKNCELPVVKLLTRRGADVNKPDGNGRGALPIAATIEGCPVDVIKFLCDEGADVKFVDKSAGLNVIHLALFYQQPLEIVKVFVERGADIHAVDKEKISSIHRATASAPEVFGFVLEKMKSKINCVAQKGLTPLHIAVCREDAHPDNIKMLLDAGANILKKNTLDEQVLHLAARYCIPQVIKLLLEYGARINCHDKNGNTPLSIMVNKSRNYNRASAKLLLDAGALIFEDHPSKKFHPSDSWPFNAMSCMHTAMGQFMEHKKAEKTNEAKDVMEKIQLLMKYAYLEKPRMCFSTFPVDKPTMKILGPYANRCYKEMQEVCIPPDVTVAQFILRSRFREEEEESLVDDVLEILVTRSECSGASSKSAKRKGHAHSEPFPLYKEVVAGLLDRGDLEKKFKQLPLYCLSQKKPKQKIVLEYDCICEVLKYLPEDGDILNLLLAIHVPKKRDPLPVRPCCGCHVSCDEFIDVIKEEYQRFYKRARIN